MRFSRFFLFTYPHVSQNAYVYFVKIIGDVIRSTTTRKDLLLNLDEHFQLLMLSKLRSRAQMCTIPIMYCVNIEDVNKSFERHEFKSSIRRSTSMHVIVIYTRVTPTVGPFSHVSAIKG